MMNLHLGFRSFLLIVRRFFLSLKIYLASHRRRMDVLVREKQRNLFRGWFNFKEVNFPCDHAKTRVIRYPKLEKKLFDPPKIWWSFKITHKFECKRIEGLLHSCNFIGKGFSNPYKFCRPFSRASTLVALPSSLLLRLIKFPKSLASFPKAFFISVVCLLFSLSSFSSVLRWAAYNRKMLLREFYSLIFRYLLLLLEFLAITVSLSHFFLLLHGLNFAIRFFLSRSDLESENGVCVSLLVASIAQ